MSSISTHILDTALGRPAAGVSITLSKQESENWQTILEKTPLRADYEHLFIQQLLCAENEQFTHIKVHIFPDGGISRLRIFGFPNWGAK